jgi:hypothetical protein
MDPVTALGLACSILQLIETAVTITKQVKEIHDRGSLSVHDEIEKWAEDIARERNHIRADVRAPAQTMTRVDKRVLTFAQQSIDVTEELKKVLNRIAFGKWQAGGNSNSLKRVVRSYVKKSKIDELTKKLQDCESELGKTMLGEL